MAASAALEYVEVIGNNGVRSYRIYKRTDGGQQQQWLRALTTQIQASDGHVLHMGRRPRDMQLRHFVAKFLTRLVPAQAEDGARCHARFAGILCLDFALDLEGRPSSFVPSAATH